jgi:ribonuclease III
MARFSRLKRLLPTRWLFGKEGRRRSAPQGTSSVLPLPPGSRIGNLEERIGYSFSDPTLLEQALTHRSFVNEARQWDVNGDRPKDYENLEFLGDSVLGLVISEFLFSRFSHRPEGDLAKTKSFLVSTTQLSRLSQDLGLGSFLRLSYGEEKTGGRGKRALLADLFESLTAAIYLDGGMPAARSFILTCFKDHLEEIVEGRLASDDYKSVLQEQLHERGLPEPRYRVIQETGPEHSKEFLVEVRISADRVATGRGRSKKEAQQQAAQNAIQILFES